jgi:hypothetical protein
VHLTLKSQISNVQFLMILSPMILSLISAFLRALCASAVKATSLVTHSNR